MARARTLLLVLAGGAGGRLELLTDHRAKPAVPYGGSYRLIDFPLSNAHHARIEDVWVVEQFHPVSMADHLANGRPWDLDRTHGGLLVLHPHLGSDREGWHRGTADALWRQAPLIAEYDPDALVVVSADAVYALDYAAVVAAHAENGADVTMVTTRRPIEEAARYGVVETDGDAVTGYAHKPEVPATDVVTTEVFVFRPERVLALLRELAADAERDDGDGLRDLGHDLLPRLVADGGAREYRFEDYWRDVGTVEAYLSSHRELVGSAEPPIRLDDPAWPILTQDVQRAPARLATGAEVADSLVSSGCRVAGRVRDSVLGPGVVVEVGAEVTGSVLLHDVVVRSGARVDRAVVDERAAIGAEARLGGAAGAARPEDDIAEDGIVLVAAGAHIVAGSEVPAGTRVSSAD